MATATFTTGMNSSNGSTMYAWAHQISAFLATAGWIQQADTGQSFWPVSIVSISAVAVSGGNGVYSYTLSQGAVLRIGNSIIIKGCTNAGNNVTAIITALGAGTFTIVNGGAVGETTTVGAAWGSVNIQVSITNAIGNGSTNTYNYTALDGVPVNGQSIVITGCTTVGFNGTLIIGSVNVGAGTFTTTTGISHASEVETGTGIVTVLAAVVSTGASASTTIPPAASNGFYEIWKMGDGNGLPIFLKIVYGNNVNNAADNGLRVTLSTGTDGAGNPTGGSTGSVIAHVCNTSSGTTVASYFSGSTNRLQLGLFPQCVTGSISPCIINIERSHAADGSDTTAYATLTVLGSGVTGVTVLAQISINATASTVSETKLPSVTKTGTLTGSFGSSTILSPVFPIIGAVGNPLIGVMIGKVADWLDVTQFSFTIYNTAHNYIIFNTAGGQWVPAGILVYDSTATCCVAMRYE